MRCGTGSFKHLVVDDDDENRAAEDSPKPRRRRSSQGGNPFAARGLDKFSMLRSDLESRREKILRRVGSDRVMVRFVVQRNGSWAPIVVKLPLPDDEKQQLQKDDAAAPNPKKVTVLPKASSLASPRKDDTAKNAAATRGMEPVRRRSFTRTTSFFSRGSKLRRPPVCYWPAVMVLLTLLSLAAFGRAFAICCTAISWYLLPTLLSSNGADDDLRVSMDKRKVNPQHEVLSSPRSSHAHGILDQVCK